MSRFPEYDHFDALGLADLVRNKQISSLELCEEAIGEEARLFRLAGQLEKARPWFDRRSPLVD